MINQTTGGSARLSSSIAGDEAQSEQLTPNTASVQHVAQKTLSLNEESISSSPKPLAAVTPEPLSTLPFSIQTPFQKETTPSLEIQEMKEQFSKQELRDFRALLDYCEREPSESVENISELFDANAKLLVELPNHENVANYLSITIGMNRVVEYVVSNQYNKVQNAIIHAIQKQKNWETLLWDQNGWILSGRQHLLRFFIEKDIYKPGLSTPVILLIVLFYENADMRTTETITEMIIDGCLNGKFGGMHAFFQDINDRITDPLEKEAVCNTLITFIKRMPPLMEHFSRWNGRPGFFKNLPLRNFIDLIEAFDCEICDKQFGSTFFTSFVDKFYLVTPFPTSMSVNLVPIIDRVFPFICDKGLQEAVSSLLIALSRWSIFDYEKKAEIAFSHERTGNLAAFIKTTKGKEFLKSLINNGKIEVIRKYLSKLVNLDAIGQALYSALKPTHKSHKNQYAQCVNLFLRKGFLSADMLSQDELLFYGITEDQIPRPTLLERTLKFSGLKEAAKSYVAYGADPSYAHDLLFQCLDDDEISNPEETVRTIFELFPKETKEESVTYRTTIMFHWIDQAISQPEKSVPLLRFLSIALDFNTPIELTPLQNEEIVALYVPADALSENDDEADLISLIIKKARKEDVEKILSPYGLLSACIDNDRFDLMHFFIKKLLKRDLSLANRILQTVCLHQKPIPEDHRRSLCSFLKSVDAPVTIGFMASMTIEELAIKRNMIIFFQDLLFQEQLLPEKQKDLVGQFYGWAKKDPKFADHQSTLIWNASAMKAPFIAELLPLCDESILTFDQLNNRNLDDAFAQLYKSCSIDERHAIFTPLLTKIMQTGIVAQDFYEAVLTSGFFGKQHDLELAASHLELLLAKKLIAPQHCNFLAFIERCPRKEELTTNAVMLFTQIHSKYSPPGRFRGFINLLLDLPGEISAIIFNNFSTPWSVKEKRLLMELHEKHLKRLHIHCSKLLSLNPPAPGEKQLTASTMVTDLLKQAFSSFAYYFMMGENHPDRDKISQILEDLINKPYNPLEDKDPFLDLLTFLNMLSFAKYPSLYQVPCYMDYMPGESCILPSEVIRNPEAMLFAVFKHKKLSKLTFLDEHFKFQPGQDATGLRKHYLTKLFRSLFYGGDGGLDDDSNDLLDDRGRLAELSAHGMLVYRSKSKNQSAQKTGGYPLEYQDLLYHALGCLLTQLCSQFVMREPFPIGNIFSTEYYALLQALYRLLPQIKFEERHISLFTIPTRLDIEAYRDLLLPAFLDSCCEKVFGPTDKAIWEIIKSSNDPSEDAKKRFCLLNNPDIELDVTREELEEYSDYNALCALYKKKIKERYLAENATEAEAQIAADNECAAYVAAIDVSTFAKAEEEWLQARWQCGRQVIHAALLVVNGMASVDFPAAQLDIMMSSPPAFLCEVIQGQKLSPKEIARYFPEVPPERAHMVKWIKEYYDLERSDKGAERFLIAVTGQSQITPKTRITIDFPRPDWFKVQACFGKMQLPNNFTDTPEYKERFREYLVNLDDQSKKSIFSAV